MDEWKLRAAGRDNHWLDCLVGCAVAADMQGCVVGGAESVRRVARKPVKSYSEKYREWKMRNRPAAW